MDPVFVDQRRKELPFSRVTIFNSSEVQTHIVIDRHSVALLPRQRKHDIELPNGDILYFQRERSPDRLWPPGHPHAGQPKPLHPIVIEGVGSMLIAGGRYE
jgi:hypothetical protein